MRKCLRCRNVMIEGLSIKVSVSVATFSMSGGGASGGGGGDGTVSVVHRHKTGGTILGIPKYKTDNYGTPKVAMCPECGELSISIDTHEEE